MTDINLLESQEKKVGKFLTWVLSYGRYIIIGTEIIVLLAFLSRFKLDRELTDLHQSIADKQAIILAASDLENQVRTLQNHLIIIKKLDQQRGYPPKLLTSFETMIPTDVTLMEIIINDSKIKLTAVALSNDGFRAFLNNLAASEYFSDISLDDVTKNTEGTGVKFSVSATLKNI